jgi:hypothetical protein
MKCATPLVLLWAAAPPRSSIEMSSPVTVLMTSGPVIIMALAWSTMSVKSVSAGE